MNKSIPFRSMAVALVLVVAVCAGLAGCFGGGDSPGTSSKTTRTTRTASTTGSVSETLPGEVTIASDDDLSTFRSKDPFVPQAQPVTTSVPTAVTSKPGTGGVPGTGTPGTVTTIPKPVIPSTPATSPSGGGTGTTGTTSSVPTSTTSTTAPHVHTLKVLSIAQVGGAPAVTFQVDGSVYREKRTGDVVSSSWGQIKVVDINSSSKVVTLLQGSETLVLSQGQLVYQ